MQQHSTKSYLRNQHRANFLISFWQSILPGNKQSMQKLKVIDDKLVEKYLGAEKRNIEMNLGVVLQFHADQPTQINLYRVHGSDSQFHTHCPSNLKQ